MSLAETLTPFVNEAPSDFTQSASRQAMEAALAAVGSQTGRVYSAWINGRALAARRRMKSINPSDKRQIVGQVADADRAVADKALAAASAAFPDWSRVASDERAAALLRMAGLLRRRKLEFCAWLIYEVGKNWREADADVAEAIDFLEYYARQELIPASTPTPVRGERNQNVYRALGPVVVIPPWNFPLAILVGMTVAAVVTGNTVVLKPSSQSPVIAAKFMELVQEAALPPGVVNLLTGAGRSIGDYLVKDPRTRMVAFTGSRTVGLHINALAAQTSRGQRWIKRVIAEMGGKNAIIVDASADVEAAAEAVVASAYGYQGQKCSACSRVFVHESVHDDFVERLLSKIKALKIGSAEVFENVMGPVISQDAMQGILRYIAIGKRQGRLLTGGKRTLADRGFYIEPTLFDRLPASSPLLHEEIFGPVLALAKVRSFADGLRQANTSVYGLTGAVFARDRSVLEEAKREFFCGNLYLNRKCTGALVGGHPFGGFNMSGTDSKAGGPDYLGLFRQGQSISERADR